MADSKITRMPQPMARGAMPAPAPQFGQPAPQGWNWTGANWECDGDGHPLFDPTTNPWYPGANAGVSFGSTPPNFPIRGHFWYDGKSLWMFDGAAWVVVGGANAGGLVGVVDGSNAAAGVVGEYILLEPAVAFAAYPAITNTTMTAGVLQPGDWDLAGTFQPNAWVGSVLGYLNPVPAGVSTGMIASSFNETPGTQSVAFPTVSCIAARANITVPTLFAFTVQINQSTDAVLTAGSLALYFSARRRR